MDSTDRKKSPRTKKAPGRKRDRRPIPHERERQLTVAAVEATAIFRALFEQSPIFSGVMSLEGTILAANRLCLDACGYRLDEVLGRPFWDCGWWRFNKDAQKTIRAATILAAHGTSHREELLYHWANGSEHVVEFALDPIRDDQGKIIFLHPSGTDITKRKRTEEDLRKTRAELETRVQGRTAELNKANESLRDLSARLIHLRDQEDRRIARELHDSVGQLLAGISMNLGVVRPQVHKLDEAGAKAFAENVLLVEQISAEIRTISYLLHPPLLDEIGLGSALHWYIEGFSERSKIKVDLEVPSDLGRLSTDLETAIFRIVQECLTNIHRHSGSKTASIRVIPGDRRVLVIAQDSGRGMSAEKLHPNSDGSSGVGFRGIAERIRHLGGHLNIHSNGGGTIVTATLPLEQAAEAAGAD